VGFPVADGLTATERARREPVRLAAGELLEAGGSDWETVGGSGCRGCRRTDDGGARCWGRGLGPDRHAGPSGEPGRGWPCFPRLPVLRRSERPTRCCARIVTTTERARAGQRPAEGPTDLRV